MEKEIALLCFSLPILPVNPPFFLFSARQTTSIFHFYRYFLLHLLRNYVFYYEIMCFLSIFARQTTSIFHFCPSYYMSSTKMPVKLHCNIFFGSFGCFCPNVSEFGGILRTNACKISHFCPSYYIDGEKSARHITLACPSYYTQLKKMPVTTHRFECFCPSNYISLKSS